MFKELTIETSRSRRLSVYHEVLMSKSPTQRSSSSLLGCLDTGIESLIKESRPAVHGLKTTTDYLPSKLRSNIDAIEPISIKRFAMENFKGHILEPRREPILSPFLHKNSEDDFRLSLDLFKLLLKYMYNQTCTKHQLDDIGRHIIKQGINNPCQRDEIFAQLCNQIYRNPDKEAQSRCCRLLLQAVGAFPPSKVVLQMLISVCKELPGSLQTQLLSTITRRMNIPNLEAARLLPASHLEMGAINGLHNPAVKINSRDGQSYIIETHSWMTNEELVNKLLRHRGIGNPHGWSVEVETETRLYYPAGSHFFYDVISEIELGKEKSDRSHFFNHCNQRLLSPINKKKADSQNKFSGAKMSPVVKRHMKQTCSDNHEVPRSVRTSPGGSHYDRSVNMQSNSITSSQSPRQTYGNDDDENNLECCYTLPVKQNPLDASHSQYSSYATIYRKRTEDDRPGLPRQQPLTSQMSKRETPDCQEVPEQCYKENNSSKRTDELLNEHLPNQYYTAANIPMVQYVPVLLPPQSTLISKQMEHAVIHPSMLVPVSNISQGSDHHPHSLSHENNYQFAQEQEQLLSSQQSQIFDGNLEEQNKTTDKDRPRDIDTMKLAVHPEFDSVRSISSVATRGGRCDSRLLNSRCDYIPSVHSTVSVASQIRNMPVPNSNRDVDRFLDEVFDQVLSPHEMAIEMNNNEIAASIKGGAYDSMTLVAKPCEKLGSCFEQRHSNTELDRTSIETENENHFENDPAETVESSKLMRSRSLPRFRVLNKDTNDFGHDTQICTTDCQSMEGNNSRIYASYSHQFTPNSGIQQSPRNGEVLTSRNNLDGQYQIYLMMPMQMNSPVSQLVPVVMQPGMTTAAVVPNMTGYTVPRQQNMLASPGQQQIRPLNSYPPSTGGMLYYPSGIVTNPVQSTYLSVQPNTVPRQMSGLVNSQQLHVATLPSPHPNYTVKPSGLTNIQQVPHQQGPVVVRNTMINSEHPNPNKFRFAEKNLVKEIQQKEQEALRKITERMKNLPPPIDQFRILTKKRDVVTHGSSVTQGCRVPNEARQTYSSLYSQTQRPQTDWVFHNGVEKRAELMPTSSAAFSLPIDPQMYHANPASLQQKPAVKYIQQPWKLNIRKEMFHPQEMLDDLNAINQVFDQIISDCRNGFTYRIRAYERDDIVNILTKPYKFFQVKHNIAPEILDKPEEIPVGVKVAVVEERSNEFISLVLSLSEHGVRLLLPTPSDTEDPLKVQDHFSFADLFNVNVENDGFLCLNARNGMTVRLRTQMAHQIKAQIDKCLFGQMELKQFVRAKCNYVTVEQNFLSFAQGDIIELVNHPNNGEALSGMWLYGKIGNRYGLFSEQYVEPVDENNREVVESPPFLSYAFDDAGDDVGHMNGHHYTMLEFALTHFRVSKPYQSSNKKNKQDDIWRTAVQMIKYTKTPITQSLIRFDSDDLNDFACETFLCIMRYMGDEQPGRGETITDSVYRLLSICYKNSPIRDEVYCQIIRQTTNNKSVREDSPIRGWRLFTILTAYFDCSIALRPYLLGYLTENADDYRRLYHGTAQLCLQNLSKTVKYGGRQFLMNATEVEEITNGKIFKRQIFGLPGGREKVVNTKIVTVVEDVIKELCQEMNIRSSSEQQEFSLFYVIENGNQSEYCANTKYILDINSELEYQHQEYHFVLKRCTWVYPLRLDNPLYIEMMYYQILPDYLNGILVTKNRNGDLNASTTEDISKLAAYIYLTTDEASRADITRQTIRSLIPSNVIDSCSLPSESWVKKIKSQLEIIRPTITATQSRALFLEVLSNWPLFGSTIFHLQSVSCDGRLIPLVVLSVGKTGVKLLNEITHDVIEEWSYDMIIYAKANCQETAVEMVVSKLEATFIYEFLTNESSAITRLVSQYTFIVKENRLLFNV
ncbi:myTH4 domain protein [Dictyocaulus viviparus]|uniref:MyTH4 domain protein n=1 Tax=Dictyocaulus viviparus TaxID=29172 RepID=A0A0D8XBA9_DICVI|nr:myTH4 domain protein [Dictyocaulus viviparus]